MIKKRSVRGRKKKSTRGRKKKSAKAQKKFKGKFVLKKKFLKGIKSLQRAKPKDLQHRLGNASKEFVNDVTTFLQRLRRRSDLVPKRHLRKMKKLRPHLRFMVRKSTSLKKKRQILKKRGGIFPLLFALIPSIIGAVGSVAAGASAAAIARS